MSDITTISFLMLSESFNAFHWLLCISIIKSWQNQGCYGFPSGRIFQFLSLSSWSPPWPKQFFLSRLLRLLCLCKSSKIRWLYISIIWRIALHSLSQRSTESSFFGTSYCLNKRIVSLYMSNQFSLHRWTPVMLDTHIGKNKSNQGATDRSKGNGYCSDIQYTLSVFHYEVLTVNWCETKTAVSSM